jgi:acetylornithine deacetylase/succinyl-diaminopimelate desuccinylase-like protein
VANPRQIFAINQYYMTNAEILEGLLDFLRIPSVSTLPEHHEDVRRAAHFVRDRLLGAGLTDARLVEGGGNPLVLASWTGAPRKPTLLLYGHYDVQPPDPLDEWKSPPFEPQIRGEDLFARGSSDDKGQVWILIHAVARLLRERGSLPVNVRFLIEGEEEIGGAHIEEFVSRKPPEIAADAVLICDTEMFAPGLPTLCVGLRGILYGELCVESARSDLHSGVYGGAAPNSLHAIAQIIAALKGASGRINIPGLYDFVRPPSPAEKAAWARLPFNEREYLEREVGAKQLTGESDFPVLERLWARPTFEVHGIRGGFTGEGAKTVIPARAVAKISLRLVPDQNFEKVEEQLRAAIAQVCPPGVQASFKRIHGAPASLVDPENRFVRSAAEALTGIFGQETVYIRSGGSIPIVGLFDRVMGIPSVMAGFGLPDDNIHAPNEKFHIPNIFRGIDGICAYLDRLGA